jgi:Holliday junction resolvase-like predicted endonuclease
VRTNQVYLNPERIAFLTEVPLDEPYRIHQKVWKFLQNKEASAWNLIEAEFETVKARPLDEVLCHCILWLETSRFENPSNQHIHHLANTYGFFMEMFLRAYSIAEANKLNDETLMNLFLATVAEVEQKKLALEQSPVFKLMAHVSYWIGFRDAFLSPYSFDMDIEPAQEGELILFNSTPDAHYKWVLNGVRYELNRKRYSLKGMEYVDYLEHKEGLIIPGKSEEQIGQNRALGALRFSTMLFLEDIKQDMFQVGRSNQIESHKLLTPLQTYSFNRLQRYEISLTKHFSSSNTWGEAFVKMTVESHHKDVRSEPFFLMSEMAYKGLNSEALSELPEDNTKEVVRLFSFRPHRDYLFNRHLLQLDVWRKPLATIGNSLFCPMMFFANNDWFYSFAQVALSQKNLSDKERRATEMEESLAEKFKERGWKAWIITQEQANLLDGDVDVFAEDDDTQLFIQLKCTYLRLNLQDAYNEVTMVEAKAAQQLNDAEVWLKQPDNGICEMHCKPVKWIVFHLI